MSFPRYPSYKDSGVEWLGAVPAHWELKRFKRIFKERETRSVLGDEMLLSVSAYTGVSPRSEVIDDGDHLSRAESLVGYKVCVKDDLVMNIMLAWNRGLAFTQHDGIVSPAYCVFSVVDNSLPRFLNYLVRSDEYTLYFKAFSAGVIDSRLRIYPDTFGRLVCSVPPPAEQAAIAAFLDGETAKIDELVLEQQRLIALLREKRQAVISRAVTKGLDPDVEMKPSGIEWLGQVPAHWDVKPMRMIANVVRGASPRPAGDPRYFGGDFIPWVTVAEITKDDDVYLAETESFLTKDGSTHSNIFRRGTLVYSNSGATLGVPKILQIDACANDGVVAFLNLDGQVQAEFLYHYLASITDNIREKVRQGSGQPNLNTDIVKDLRFGLPPIEEQERIVSRISELANEFGALAAEAQRAIELLQERRNALISGAVTGQINVVGLIESEAA
jgi:type I restriction enzyme S subunit